LGIGSGIGDDDEAGLLEGSGDVVGKVTRREATSNCNGTGVRSEFEDSSLAVGAGGDDTNVCWIIDSNDDSSS
jgi:hypothetical protein